MEVIIDGVRYVPALEAHADMTTIAKALLSWAWGPVSESEDLTKLIEEHSVYVNDSGKGEPLEEVLADIAQQLATRHQSSVGTTS